MEYLRLFGSADVPRGVRGHAEALWTWFDVAGSSPERAIEDLRLIESGSDPLTGAQAWRDAKRACDEADLESSLLLPRLRASGRLAGGLQLMDGHDLHRFAEDWCGSHARMLARLLGLTGSWQQEMTSDLARGLFLVETVVRARDHVEAGRCFFPSEDLERFDSDLDRGDSPGVRKVLWKQAVRARDALAQGRPLIEELSPVQAYRARKSWFGALELLVQAESRSWDVWSHGSSTGFTSRFRTFLQAVAGKTAFRRR